jgi:toxin YhaV
LRASGSKSDPYIVFQRMLERGHPPDDWADLLSASHTDWK